MKKRTTRRQQLERLESILELALLDAQLETARLDNELLRLRLNRARAGISAPRPVRAVKWPIR